MKFHGRFDLLLLLLLWWWAGPPGLGWNAKLKGMRRLHENEKTYSNALLPDDAVA